MQKKRLASFQKKSMHHQIQWQMSYYSYGHNNSSSQALLILPTVGNFPFMQKTVARFNKSEKEKSSIKDVPYIRDIKVGLKSKGKSILR
jgi:hypothetical protein